jgi:putative endonuclease
MSHLTICFLVTLYYVPRETQEMYDYYMAKPTGNRTQKQVIGKIGEDAVCQYLQKKGFRIIDRNYLKKWGELDIVVSKGKRIYFIEVKSVSREMSLWNVSRETGYRAEDNMHPWKLQRLSRTIQSYLLDKHIPDSIEWQFDVATVYVDQEKRLCRVYILENVIL